MNYIINKEKLEKFLEIADASVSFNSLINRAEKITVKN